MTARVHLGDGGPLYHPRQPVGFHPHLRAAAFLLLCAEKRLGSLVASFRRDVFTAVEGQAWGLVARALTGPRLCLAGESGSALVGRRHSGLADGLVTAAQRWAQERHLAGANVLELLLLTLVTWGQLARESGAGPTAFEPRGAAGWGPWVDVLTALPEESAVGGLLERRRGWPCLRLAPRGPSEIRVTLSGWMPEMEDWATAEERLRSEVEAVLDAHRRRCETEAQRQGLAPVPVVGALRHFDWLALRQVAGWRPSRIARRSGVAVSTVHAALSKTSSLVGLPLRPVKPGPEEVLG